MYILRIYNQLKPLLSNVCRTTNEELNLHKLYLEYLLKEYEYPMELAFKDNGNVKEFMDNFTEDIIQKERERIKGLSYEQLENLIEDDDALKKLTELSSKIFEQARKKKLTGTFNATVVYTTMEMQVLSLYENIRRLNKSAATQMFNETLLDLKYLYNKSQKQSERLQKETNREIGLIDTVLENAKQAGRIIENETIIRDVLVKLYARFPDFTEDNKYALCMYYVYAITDGQATKEKHVDIINSIIGFEKEELQVEISKFKWIPQVLKKALELGNDLFERAKKAYLFYNFEEKDGVDSVLDELIALKPIIENEQYLYRDKNEVLSIYTDLVEEAKLDAETSKGNREIQSKRLKLYLEEMATLDYLPTDKGLAS